MSKTIRRSVTSARQSFSGEAGIGIVQVMAGIILGAIIAAAGVFSTLQIIDWGQDNAAKTALEDVRTAQEVYMTKTADTSTGGNYGSIEALQGAGLLSENADAVTVQTSTDGNDYGAAIKSKAGTVYVINTHDSGVTKLADTTEEGLGKTVGESLGTAGN